MREAISVVIVGIGDTRVMGPIGLEELKKVNGFLLTSIISIIISVTLALL